ncbi:MAG: helix-turn-helix domain-containing protein [Anaerolineaceae bacterium]
MKGSKINETEARVRECFSERLRGLRKGRKLSQDEFGAALGLSRGSISYYEKQSRTAPINVLYAVADYFGVSADFLLGLKEEPDPYVEEVEPGQPGTSRCAPRIAKEVSSLAAWRSELWSAFTRSSLSLSVDSGLRDSLFAAVMGTMDAYMVAAQFLQSGKPLAELVTVLQSSGVSAELSMSILAQVSGFQKNVNVSGGIISESGKKA